MWIYSSYKHKDNKDITQSQENPYLYYGHIQNNFSTSVKTALYQAIPQEAQNIRIKKGNGVLDCDTYKFAYVDRYIDEEECAVLDYSFYYE